ncbi:hypothetical protein AURDEDRAFT_183852 [Auricularia subglabra TFB-10046 SS5]|nr:hypothetical protein AURDEDRAFT_183852 [Auricularia subglabra TFB-10046 SS5]
MIHWNDPAVVLSALHLTTFGLCILLGILLWEVVTNLRLDWALLRRRQRFTASYIPYSISRMMGITALLAGIVVTSAGDNIDCMGPGSSRLRVYSHAVGGWDIALADNRRLRAKQMGRPNDDPAAPRRMMLKDDAELTKMRFARAPPPLAACVELPGNQGRSVAVAMGLVAFDFLCLSLFILILRRGGPSGGGVWKLLYHQGVVWFIFIAVMHTVGLTLLILDLNQPIDVLSQLISGLTTFGLCILLGALLWETITGLWLDWALVTRRQRFSAAYIPYAISRVLGVVSLVASITATTAEEGIDCSGWALTTYACAYLATLAADAISLLRTVAISGKNKWVLRTIVSYYVGMCAFMLYELTRMRFAGAPDPVDACVALSDEVLSIPVALILVVYDALCLSISMAFLRRGSPGHGLWKLLYQQGFVWFISIAVTHSVGMTFIVLNLNQPITELSQATSMTVIIICATRMHRGLMKYHTPCSSCLLHSFPEMKPPAFDAYP